MEDKEDKVEIKDSRNDNKIVAIDQVEKGTRMKAWCRRKQRRLRQGLV